MSEPNWNPFDEQIRRERTTATAAVPARPPAEVPPGAPTETALGVDQENAFQDWLKRQRNAAGGPVANDLPVYDVRGLYLSLGGKDVPPGHGPDTYKRPTHPTFSDESIYHGVGTHEGGHWSEDGTKFYASPWNVQNMGGPAALQGYFHKFESGVELVLPSAVQAGANPFDDQIRREREGQAGALNVAFSSTAGTDPDRQAEVLRLGRASGLPVDLVGRNVDEVSGRVAASKASRLLANAPELGAWYSDQNNAAVARDDVANLHGIAWAIGAPFHALWDKIREQETVARQFREYAGGGDEANRQRIGELEQAYGEKDYGAKTWWQRAYLAPWKMAPLIVGDLASRYLGYFAGTAIGTLGGAAAGGAAGAPAAGAGAVPGAAVGGTAGGTALGVAGQFLGSAAFNFFEFAGPLYSELSKLRDDSGKPLDPRVVRASATAGAAIDGLLMAGLFGRVASAVPGVGEALESIGAQTVRRALAQKTVGTAAAQLAKKYGEHVLSGALLMAAQSGVNAATRETAKAASGQPIDVSWSRIPIATAEGFGRGLEDMLLLAALRPGRAFLQDLGRVHAVSEGAARLEALTQSARASKLRARMPEKFQEVVRQLVAEHGEVQNVSVPVERWDAYWRDQGLDPAAVARNVLSDPARYGQAVQNGGDVVIPIENYLTHLAPTEHHAALRPDLRLYQGDPTPRELAEAYRAETERTAQLAQEPVESLSAPDHQLYDTERARAIAAGLDETQADVHARNQTAFWRVMAARTGGGSALELYRRYEPGARPAETAPPARAEAGQVEASEVSAAERAQGLDGLPGLREGLTAAEVQEHAHAIQKARAEGEAALRGRITEDQARLKSEAFLQELDRAREQVRAEAAQDPVQAALWFLRNGSMADGSEIPDTLRDEAGQPVKLSRHYLIDRYGKPILSEIPRGFVEDDTGAEGPRPMGHPDVVAGMFGVSSGDELVQALRSGRAAVVDPEAEARRRVENQHGNLANEPMRLSREAMDAVHGEARGEQLAVELRLLKRQAERTGTWRPRPPVSVAGALERARTETLGKRLSEISPFVIERTERMARRAAVAAAARGDMMGAYEANERALWNYALYRAAVDLRRQGEAATQLLAGAARPAARAKIGLVDPLMREQAEAILERFGYLPRGPQRTRTLFSWASEAEERWGDEVSIDDRLFDEAWRKPAGQLTVDELLAVRNAIHNISHLAANRGKVLTAEGKVELADAVRELREGALRNVPDRGPRPISHDAGGRLEGVGEWISEKGAEWRRLENIFRLLDGADINGPWQRYIWNPIKAARTKSYELADLHARKFLEALEALPGDVQGRLAELVFIPEIGQPLSRREILMVGANTGNDSNYFKLAKGYGWTDGQIEAITKHLGKAEWDWLQATWDSYEGMWPEIVAHQERTTGLPPEKVQARPVRTEYGTYRGGYFPAVYARDASVAGERQAISAPGQIFDRGYFKPTTPQGYTKSRIEDFARPISLDMSLIPAQMAQHIHDVAFREAVISVGKLILNEEVRDTIRRTAGKEYVPLLLPWLRGVANDRIYSTGDHLSSFDRMLDTTRSRATVGILAYKVAVISGNLSNIVTARAAAKGTYLTGASIDLMRSPRETWEFVKSKSPGEMAHRVDNVDRDIRDKVRELATRYDIPAKTQRFGMRLISLSDMVGSVPAWLGAYRQYLAEHEGVEDAEAVRYADQQVRRVFGGSQAEDLPALLRNPGAWKLLTMFQSYMNSQYNLGADLAGDVARSARRGTLRQDLPEQLAESVALVLGLTVVNEYLAGRGPDKDERWAAWALRKLVVFPFAVLPFPLREAGSMLEAKLRGRGRGQARTSPALELLTKTWEAGADAWDIVTGPPRRRAQALEQAAEVAATWAGLPVAQPRLTGHYLWDVYKGREHPDSAWQFMRGVLYGSKRKKGR
jgi:hypothetical protein